ncbi:hypothetical protein WMY93_010035 [Mugilogobius chulae]|uniref:Protein kinase domain-containing protein n=1 Tax=Mugilogobius chulae TaxID=88201 RepID=A0AAW0PBY2_9GOBI
MDLKVNPDDIYEQLKLMGEGTFGKVTKCRNKNTGEIVAVKKITVDHDADNVIARELSMLRAIRYLDKEVSNIIKFNQHFESPTGDHYLEFEALDQSVFDLQRRRKKAFSLKQIRVMGEQLFVALDALKGLGVMHTDIKSDNIMLVAHKEKPFKVKLIDFGLGLLKSRARVGMTLSTLPHRAPEVTLGLPLSEAVDMWSLGVCLLEWYLQMYPFNPRSPYDHVKQICHVLGVPDDYEMAQSLFGREYFIWVISKWRLRTPHEYRFRTGEEPEIGENPLEPARNLNDVVMHFYPEVVGFEMVDRMMFLDLLQKIFVLNPEERITPEEALKHPFISMSHISKAFNYALDSARMMNFKSVEDSDEEVEDQNNLDMLERRTNVNTGSMDFYLYRSEQVDLKSGSQSLVELPHGTSEDEGRQAPTTDITFLDELFKKGDPQDITQMLNFLEMTSVDPPVSDSNCRILPERADKKMIICLSPPLRNSPESPVVSKSEDKDRQAPTIDITFLDELFKKGEVITQMQNFLEMTSEHPPLPKSNCRTLPEGADEEFVVCQSPPLRNSPENPVVQSENVRWRKELEDTEGPFMMPKMESRTINIFRRDEAATCEARSRLPVIDFAEPSPNSAQALENAEEVIRQQPLPFANIMEEQALDPEEENSLWFPALIQPVLNYIRPFSQCLDFRVWASLLRLLTFQQLLAQALAKQHPVVLKRFISVQQQHAELHS